MSDALGGLYREAKCCGHLSLPIFHHSRLRKTIEGVVDFDRGQALRVVREHVFRRQILWVKVAFPLFVAVTTGTDVKFHASLLKETADAPSLTVGFRLSWCALPKDRLSALSA